MSNDNRINGAATGAKPPDDPPQTMEELLGRAHNHWKFSEKDKAFMELIAAMQMMSTGVAQAMKDSQDALRVARVALDNSEKQ